MMLSVVTSTRDTWEEFKFSEFQKFLESTVIQLATNRENGDTAKSSLVKLTREFIQHASEETRKSVLSLLKSFQSEIDTALKRCSFAEDSYTSVYEKMIDLPDPSLALSEIHSLLKKANRTTELEYETKKLKEQLEQMKNETSDVKRLANEKARLQHLLDETVNSMDLKMDEKCNSLVETFRKSIFDKEHEMLSLKAQMEEKVKSLEEKSVSLTRALENSQSELFNLKSKVDESTVGRSNEWELLMNDLESANLRIRDLESRLSATDNGIPSATFDSLNEQIQSLKSRADDLESELIAKINELSACNSTLNTVCKEKHLLEETTRATIDNLNQSLSDVTNELSMVKRQLEAQSNYDDVCRELAFLRSIEFPEEEEFGSSQPNFNIPERGEPEGDIDTRYKEPTSPQLAAKPSLESLLMNKNRMLQNQLAAMSTSKDQLTVELQHLRSRDQEMSQQLREQGELIALLESDLHRLQQAYEGSRRSHAPNFSAQYSPSATEGKMLAEAIGEQQSAPAVVPHVDSSLLQIVEHQRDRFRARTNELEQVDSERKQQLIVLQREVESIRADNVKLYEKIRFLQSYSTNPHKSINLTDQSTTVRVQSDAFVEKYSQAYEARLDPFSDFNRKERQRHYHGLRPHEKLMFHSFRLVVGNRGARLGAFIYALLLHLLVFLSLYRAAHFQTTADETQENCLKKYAEHMHDVHKLPFE